MESSRIFVRGLPTSLGANDFQSHFSTQYPTTDAKLIPHRRIGYVGYKTPQDAANAVKYYNKTFIRMSRIGVEIARSIEEQSALRPGTNATNRVKRKYGDTEADSPHMRKRYDGIQAVEETAKLQEFLEVMQPPSKSKIWEDQAAMTTQTPAEPSMNDRDRQNSDAGIDEEYEPVPKRQKRNREIAQETQLKSGDSQMETDLHEHKSAVSAAGGDVTLPLVNTAGAGSDADWLRTRTSRLLGLVDDDDAQETIALPDDDQAQKSTASGDLEQNPSKNVLDTSIQTEREGNKVDTSSAEVPSANAQGSCVGNGRLFIRNLAYSATEDDLRLLLENGKHGAIEEIHLSIDSRSGMNKGFAHVQFVEPEAAAQALLHFDQQPFQGRLLHVMPASAKKETGLDDFAISKLPLKKQQQIKKKAEAATSTFNWNSMYMNADAIMSSISDRLGVLKSELLDPTSSNAAVRQAHAETHIIQETRTYFTTNGVDLDAFKHKERGDRAILIKNFVYGTKPEELRKLFEPHGSITRLLMPPSGTIAVIEYGQRDHARSAFSSLAYRKFKDSILFLEKAPKGLLNGTNQVLTDVNNHGTKVSANELLAKEGILEPVNTSTLFVQNLNFITNTKRLREIFEPLDGFLSARVKTKPDLKKPGQLLSMGFGFVEFRTKENARSALSAMDGFKLDGHDLLIRASHKAIDAAEERRKADLARKEGGKKTKIIIKNLPFEASRHDVRSLFGAYGQLRSVRVPKKFDSSTRGFAFAEFVTAREAENAMDALRDTHLLGRRLVLEFAAEDALDPEQEIERMQHKVGKQADKVALQLQHLTGSARKKFNVEGGEELDQG